MVIKTREKLIEVARQLFAHKGIENTTMNDIANASDKGRRTIYTYFKNKKEIYNAVIEQESEQMVSQLREILQLNISPVEKLRRFLEIRFALISDFISQGESIKRFFGLDIKRVEKIRKLASEKENEILRSIIDDGINQGFFDESQCKYFESLQFLIFQSTDMSYLEESVYILSTDKDRFTSDIIEFIINGLKNKK
jgi:AcrR family transcriptional regulator